MKQLRERRVRVVSYCPRGCGVSAGPGGLGCSVFLLRGRRLPRPPSGSPALTLAQAAPLYQTLGVGGWDLSLLVPFILLRSEIFFPQSPTY